MLSTLQMWPLGTPISLPCSIKETSWVNQKSHLYNKMAPLTFLNVVSEQSMFFSLLLLPLTFFVLWRRLPTTKKQHASLPPSPPGLPILGNLHQVGPLPHRSLAVLAAKHGPLMLLYLGQVPTLVVSSAPAAREIMKNNNLIFSSRPPFKVAKSVLYGGVDMAFAPYGEFGRNVRKICVTNLLSAKMVQSFGRIREEEVDIMMKNISSQAPGVVNISEVLNTFVNDILCRVISKKFSREQGRKKNIRELVQETSALFGTFHVGDYIPYLGWVDGLLGLDGRGRRNSKGWDDVLDELIDDVGHADRTRGDEGVYLVDVLISLQKDPTIGFQLTRENIKALIVDMLAAGTDPPYIVLEWAMAELVLNPQTMKKLKDVVRGIANGKAKIQEEDLSRMIYLKNVLKEVLRLHPPVPVLVPRELMEECCIQGYTIPCKARVIINEWAISRESKFWEAAEEFRPERFINNPIDYRGNDYQFIPFGAGRRICPGMNFAVAITELALANLVNQFEWELPDGVTKENMDMNEAPGLASRKKTKPSTTCEALFILERKAEHVSPTIL